MSCLNHPTEEAAGVCQICGNPYCGRCLEQVGEHRVCLDCIESIAESSLDIRETSFLTKRLMVAGIILLGLGFFVILSNTIRFLDFIQAVFLGVGTAPPLVEESMGLFLEGVKAFVYLLAGYGVFMGRGWSYWLGLAIAVGALIFELYSLVAMPNRWSLLMLASSASILLLISSSRKA